MFLNTYTVYVYIIYNIGSNNYKIIIIIIFAKNYKVIIKLYLSYLSTNLEVIYYALK